MSLVLELQKDCLNADFDTMNLLRKAFLVAKKLEINDFAEWIQCEMNGYAGHDVPEYRKVYGKMMATDGYGRKIPVVVSEDLLFLCERNVINSIASIHAAIQSNKNSLKLAYPNEIDALLVKEFGQGHSYHLEVGVDQFEEIEQCVINKVLEWAIVLEGRGIIGEGLSFSEEEKNIAKNEETIKQISIIINGDVINSQIQQETANSQNSNF